MYDEREVQRVLPYSNIQTLYELLEAKSDSIRNPDQP